LLADRHDTRVVGVASGARKGLELAKSFHPSIVLIGDTLSDMDGPDAVRALAAAVPGVRLIAFGSANGAGSINRLIDAGALSYLTPDVDAVELSAAIDEVTAGRIYVSHDLRRLMDAEPTPQSDVSTLTERQLEVLKLMAEGKSTRQIAEALDVSVKTIETHRKHIMDRLGIHTVAELTKYAVREGITTLWSASGPRSRPPS
jgi:DNA-binding NarL/FixJ family response regulator